MSVRAITFDLWDTIVVDDSDEPRRASLGLATKSTSRRTSIMEVLRAHGATSPEEVVDAYDLVEREFHAAWQEKSVTWPLRERLERVLRRLGRTLPAEAFDQLVETHAWMEVDVPPDLVEGCAEALERLSRTYQLAIVSDAVVSPGTSLRRLLEDHGVGRFFNGFAFSDEVGRSKPHSSMFQGAADQLGVPVESMIHVGDREAKDVVGAHDAGLQAVLFTASRATDREGSTADAICERYCDLPGIIARLAGDALHASHSDS